MSEATLLIFMRNPIFGKVKTRIAATLGDETALRIYQLLVAHTASIIRNIEATKIIYYSDFVDETGPWDETCFNAKQNGADLGERMSDASKEAFKYGLQNLVLIGTDCYDLTTDILAKAFMELRTNDAVIGPALDGGYYLLGVKRHHPLLFDNIEWSTNKVLEETISRCVKLGLKYFLLPELSDIDEEADVLKTDILQRI